MQERNIRSQVQAILAAVLFGASTPMSKLLLRDIDPTLLAALLYFGCGLGTLTVRVLQKLVGRQASKEAGLSSKDGLWLAGAILAGGVAAPIVLLHSLRVTPASTASLLLNFEGVATAVIAAMAFKEALGKRIWTSVAFITIAGIILTLNVKGEWGFSAGSVGIVMACVLWGIDNNFTRNISSKDPLAIVTVKGIIAGGVSLVIAVLTGCSVPSYTVILTALVLGFLSYGISIMFFIYAMRGLGAARASAFFGSAPFVGTMISLIMFRELPDINFMVSLPIMIAGAVFILWEEHTHVHKHEPFGHEHRHAHDDHHSHPHEDDGNKEHTHWHFHEEMKHEHFHTPDIHHRHVH